jgi:Flp pilus assembly pilin Flp
VWNSRCRGQTILEYTILVGIVSVVLYYMGTGIKRGVQSMIKVTADQVGNQQNADQDYNLSTQGYVEVSNTFTQMGNTDQTAELGTNSSYMENKIYDETTTTLTNTITNGGFSPTSD